MKRWSRNGRTRSLLAANVLVLLLPGLCSGQSGGPVLDENRGLRKAGDIIHILLPLAAGGTAAIKKDWEGIKQFGFSLGAANGTVFGLKEIVEKSRPDGGDNRSFPSGHTMISFSSASFIQRRYGNKLGIPALAAAGFVGFSRIKGQKHFADDVIAGAGIALLYNYWLVKPLHKNVQIQPLSKNGGYGMELTAHWSAASLFPTRRRFAGENSNSPSDEERLPYRIAFEFGVADWRRLENQSPPDFGTPLSLERGERNATPTARVKFDWKVRDRHELNFWWVPLEGRDFELVFDEDVSFGGAIFPAGKQTAGRSRFEEMAARYRYAVVDTPRFVLRLGGAVSFQETKATLAQDRDEFFREITERKAVPLAHGQLLYHLGGGVHALGELDWIQLGKTTAHTSYFAGVRWAPRRNWDFDFGYRNLNRRLDQDDLKNRMTIDYFAFGFGYSF